MRGQIRTRTIKNHLTPKQVRAIVISLDDEMTNYARIYGHHEGVVRSQPGADSSGAAPRGIVRLPNHGTIGVCAIHNVQTPFHPPSSRFYPVPQVGALGALSVARPVRFRGSARGDCLGAEIGRRHATGRQRPDFRLCKILQV